MRPLNELFMEDYWEIAYRTYTAEDSVVSCKGKYTFKSLTATTRYWYADPFLFSHDGVTYLFIEMFDNTIERGVIGCSKLENGAFTTPEVVLEEPFHLSYPNVFENDGQIYMMPETHEDHCIQLYRAVEFPTKWEKARVLVPQDDVVDTVLLDQWLLTTRVVDGVAMKTHLELFDFATGEAFDGNPVSEDGTCNRGGGALFERDGRRIRPAQNCTGAFYGAGLVFYEIGDELYTEKEIGRLNPENLDVPALPAVYGIHTYACNDTLEVIDVKAKRFNMKRLFWILKKKLG